MYVEELCQSALLKLVCFSSDAILEVDRLNKMVIGRWLEVIAGFTLHSNTGSSEFLAREISGDNCESATILVVDCVR